MILFEIKKSRFFNIAEFQKESILTFMSDSFYLIHSTPNTFFTFSNSKIYKIDLNTLKSNPINLIVPDSLKNAKIVGVANGSINIYIEKKDVNFSLELSDNKITKIEFNKRFDDKIEWIHIDYKLLSYGTTFNKKSKQVPVIGYKNKAFKVIGNTEGQIIGINAQNQVLGNWFNSMTQVPGVFVFDLKSQPKGAEFPVWTDLFPDVPSYLTSVNYEFVIGSKFNEPFIYSNKKVFLLNELLKSTKLPLSKITKVMKVSHSGVIFCEAINLSGAIGYYIIFKLVN
ncbi:MAG: hypothetical protein SFY32_00865 [Bacteroidota bacterium]|nr:hypothetical protein [Bacteroidota bacterium]